MTTRPLLPVLAFALLAFVGDGDLVSGARATERLAPPASFRNLRVCSYGAFSRAQDRCTKDERGVVLVSNRISCSVDIIVRKTAVLRSQMTYLGQTISFGPATFYPSRSAQRWWIDLNLRAALPLPGGSWSCRFSMGSARVGASFETDGPTGDIVDTAACRGADTVRFGSGRACLTDESSSPIPPTDSLWCYA